LEVEVLNNKSEIQEKRVGFSVEVLNNKGEVTEKVSLIEEVFNHKVVIPVLHEVIKGYLNNRRLGTASSKTRGLVSGSGRKLWKQKGTGRARVGSIRSPLWRGGGTVFGPLPKDYYGKLPAKVKKKALYMSLSDKILNQKIKVINEFSFESFKTKEAANILSNLNLRLKKVLIVVGEGEERVVVPFRNIKGIKVIKVNDLNAYEILLFPEMLFTKKALDKIQGYPE